VTVPPAASAAATISSTSAGERTLWASVTPPQPGVENAPGWGGVTLAHNVRSPAEVDEIVAAAEAAGGTVTRAPAKTFWGGYSGAFCDLDAHPWEIAHNPHWAVHDDGTVTLAP